VPGTHQPRPHLPAPAPAPASHHHQLPRLRSTDPSDAAEGLHFQRKPRSFQYNLAHFPVCNLLFLWAPARADHVADDICFTAFLSWPTTYRVVSYRFVSCRVVLHPRSRLLQSAHLHQITAAALSLICRSCNTPLEANIKSFCDRRRLLAWPSTSKHHRSSLELIADQESSVCGH